MAVQERNSEMVSILESDFFSSRKNIKMQAGNDVYPDGDQRGLARRLVTPWGSQITDHFRSGVIPSGYSWLTSGTLDGTNAGSPLDLTYNRADDFLYGYPDTSNSCFLYKSTVMNPLSYSIWANFGPSQTGATGIRLDKNSDDDFFEFYLEDVGSLSGRWRFIYKIASARTLVTGTIDHPLSLFYSARLYCIDEGGGNQVVGAYLTNPAGAYVAFAFSSSHSYWGSTTIRSGLIFKIAGGGNFVDSFYNQF